MAWKGHRVDQPKNQTFVVQGVMFYAAPSTDYDDGLRRFADLAV